MQKSDLNFKKQCLYVSGELTFATVSELSKKAADVFRHQDVRCIDFAGVTTANSAALALILEWMRLAKKYEHELSCLNLPNNVLNIIKASDLSELIK